MEKGNDAAGATQSATSSSTTSGTSTAPEPGKQTSAAPGTGTASESPPPPSGAPQAAPPDGGELAPTKQREILHQGPHESTYPDGSKLRLDGQGGAEFEQGYQRARLEGDDWVDPKTGQRVERGVWAKADYRLRELERRRGLNPPPRR